MCGVLAHSTVFVIQARILLRGKKDTLKLLSWTTGINQACQGQTKTWSPACTLRPFLSPSKQPFYLFNLCVFISYIPIMGTFWVIFLCMHL